MTLARLLDTTRPRSAPPRRKVRMALHAQARKLARHGRIRARRSDQAVPEPPHPDKQTLNKEVAAWEHHRNKHHAKADWQFTTHHARVKLKRLYPTGTSGSYV